MWSNEEYEIFAFNPGKTSKFNSLSGVTRALLITDIKNDRKYSDSDGKDDRVTTPKYHLVSSILQCQMVTPIKPKALQRFWERDSMFLSMRWYPIYVFDGEEMFQVTLIYQSDCMGTIGLVDDFDQRHLREAVECRLCTAEYHSAHGSHLLDWFSQSFKRRYTYT